MNITVVGLGYVGAVAVAALSKAGCRLQKVIHEMRRAGVEIKRTSWVFEMPYHRFFVLEVGKR